MTTLGLASHKRGRLRPCCPDLNCRSLNLRHYPRGDTWRCYTCGMGFKTPGMREPMLHREAVKEAATRPKPLGSGVVGEPCREREFRELHRDPFSHRDLCMMIKR